MEYEITKILESDVDLSKKTKKLNLNSYNNIYMINSLFNEKESEKKLKELLKRENEIGIIRQELVAMIPINLIDINDTDIILDLCAAPGNKSSQILEKYSSKRGDYSK